MTSLIRLECRIPEGSFSKLPWASCLEIAGSVDHAHPRFFLTIWFQRECGAVLLSVAIMGHVFCSTVKSEAENDIETEFLMTSNGGLNLCDDEKLAW
jgi:hypothetical protein